MKAGLKDNTFTKCYNWTELEPQWKLITSVISVAAAAPRDLLLYWEVVLTPLVD